MTKRLPRNGGNPGGWTTWIAKGLSAQRIKNPALEPGIDRGFAAAGDVIHAPKSDIADVDCVKRQRASGLAMRTIGALPQ